MLTGDNISAYKINIDGTYTEAVGMNLTGTFSLMINYMGD